jgi:hypothetical protein
MDGSPFGELVHQAHVAIVPMPRMVLVLFGWIFSLAPIDSPLLIHIVLV